MQSALNVQNVLTYKALNNLTSVYISSLLKPPILVLQGHLKMDFSPYLDIVLRYTSALSHTLAQTCGTHNHIQSKIKD